MAEIPNHSSPVTACIIAYANYFTDARIKNYVQALLKKGYEVDVFALGQPETCPPGLRVVYLTRKVESRRAMPYLLGQIWFLAWSMYQAGRSSIARHYRIVHVHNMPDFIVFCALIPKILGAKVILDVHDTMPEAYATKFDLPLTHPLIRMIRIEERFSAAFSDHVITTNDLHRQALIEHGIPPEKISIIMNVGNEVIFHPRPHSNPSQGLTLGYHGTIAARLGLDLILDAIRLAQPFCPHLRFLLIGDGEFMPTVRKLIHDNELVDIVQVIGWVSVETLPGLLSAVDVGIIGNRRHTEERRNWMLPVKMLEYAVMEIPTIAPRLRVIEHYFNDTNSILYEPDSIEALARSILNIYEHPEQLSRLKQGLRDFNARYNWPNMERSYLQIIEGLTGLK